MRGKLIELICSVKYGKCSLIGKNFKREFIEKIANHLIAHGVTFATDNNAKGGGTMRNGSGCINCSVRGCTTTQYRGSVCASLRDKMGLGDPMTKGDQIREMPDEELAWEFIYYRQDWGYFSILAGFYADKDKAFRETVKRLREPAQEERKP